MRKNVAEYAEFCREHSQVFSERATHELHELADMVYKIVGRLVRALRTSAAWRLERISTWKSPSTRR
jgi:hypothetical protein